MSLGQVHRLWVRPMASGIPTDIAPTVTQMLHIQQPNACIGEAITEIIDGD